MASFFTVRKLRRIRRNVMFTDTEEVYIEEDSIRIK